MKKILVLSAVFLLLFMPVSQAANPKAGAACPKVKATKVYNGKLFTCLAKGKAKVWDKGTPIKSSGQPRPGTSPKPSPSNSNSSKTTVLNDAGAFGVVRTVSNNGGNAQPMECKASDGNQGFRSQKTFWVDPLNPNHLGIGIEYKGFYTSNDGGATWKISSTGLIGYPLASDPKKPCHTEFSMLAMDWQDFNHLVMARAGEPGTIKDYFSENAGLYESKDGGQSWKQILTQPGISVYVHDGLAISHQNSAVIYAGTTTNARTLNGDNKVYATKGIIYKTVNGGKSWTELPTGAPADTGVQAIAVDPQNDQIITAATFSRVRSANGNSFGPGLGIIKSTDGGATWTRMDSLTTGFSTIEFFESDPRVAMGVTFDGQVVSTHDSGVTWTKVNGISTARAIAYYLIDPSQIEGLVAGEQGELTAFGHNGEVVVPAGQIPALAGHSTRVTRIAYGTDGAWYVAGHYTDNKSHQSGFVFKSTDTGKTWVKILDTDTLR
jgi:photosystem II stability/assembly factor-like uncharacterized protein